MWIIDYWFFNYLYRFHHNYCKIPKISPGAYSFQRSFSEGLIFGVACIQRGLSMEGNLPFKIDWASLTVGSKFTVFAFFTLYLRAIFQVQAPVGLYLEGWFNGGFFALPVCRAYIWRGLFMEGLIFGILRYNKILKSDWLSTILISALIGQCKRTVCIMPK